MFYFKPLALSTGFIEQINASLLKTGSKKLSFAQCTWLSICITGVIITNSVCWKRFERAGFGKFSANTISKMFKRGKICWENLLRASVLNVFEKYDITEGVLVECPRLNGQFYTTSKQLLQTA